MIVRVTLLSGKEATLEVDPSWTINDLKQSAQMEMGLGLGKLMNDCGEVLPKTATISQAGVQDGETLTATVRPDALQLVASWQAFSVLRTDGSVVSWGNAAAGGDNRDVQDQLLDVKHVKATASAFAAIRGDGTVVAWGDPGAGGDCSSVFQQLREVTELQAGWKYLHPQNAQLQQISTHVKKNDPLIVHNIGQSEIVKCPFGTE